jgi:hypothetical protein
MRAQGGIVATPPLPSSLRRYTDPLPPESAGSLKIKSPLWLTMCPRVLSGGPPILKSIPHAKRTVPDCAKHPACDSTVYSEQAGWRLT